MNVNSRLLLWTVIALLLLLCSSQVECRRTYSSSSSRRGSSNNSGSRRRTQSSSGGGLFSSWFGGSKSTGSSSASKPLPSSSSTAQKNWQTATSHVSTGSKSSGWANPYYKPSAPSVPSAPKTTNYGWKSAPPAGSKTGSLPYPSSNTGSHGYPVQSGTQQSNFGGFKPAPSLPNSHGSHVSSSQSNFGGFKPVPSAPNVHSTHVQSPQSNFGGYKPASSVPNTHSTNFQPSQTNFAANKPASSVPNTHGTSYQSNYGHTNHAPTNNFGGYHSTGTHNTGYNPSGGYHPPQPSYNAPHYSPSHNPTGYHTSAYPQQTYSSHHQPSYNNFGYSPSFGAGLGSATYQGNKLFGGSSGHYGYSGSGNWGIPSYGSTKSSGTGKLLTGLAVGAAGGYLTSSLVNRISNPWKYSGYGYGSGFGYGSGLGGYGGLGYSGLGYSLSRDRDESAFERGYVRGFKDRQEDKDKNAPVAPPPSPAQEEDPTSKWVHCVAFDPQTQQTLINPNCSCTVTTTIDERTGQPISAHHCTTLNGLVLKPIPVVPNQGIQTPPGDFGNMQPPPGSVNAPGAVPSYLDSYQGGYGSGYSIPVPSSNDGKTSSSSQVDTRVSEPTGEKVTGASDSKEPANVDMRMSESATSKSIEETMSASKAVSQMETTASKTASDKSAEDSSMGSSTAQTNMEEETTGSVAKPGLYMTQNVEKADMKPGLMSGENDKKDSANMANTPDKVNQEIWGPLAAEKNQKSAEEFYGKLQKIVSMGNFINGG